MCIRPTAKEKWGMSVHSTVLEKWCMSECSTIIEKWGMSMRSNPKFGCAFSHGRIGKLNFGQIEKITGYN